MIFVHKKECGTLTLSAAIRMFLFLDETQHIGILFINVHQNYTHKGTVNI